MGTYANVNIINEKSIFTLHRSVFLDDVIFSNSYDDELGLLTVLTKEDKVMIKPYQEDAGYKPRNPKEFKNVFLKIQTYLKEKDLYNDYKKDIEDIINLCDKAIELNKKVDFTWSN